MASYDLDLPTLSGFGGLNLSEVRFLDSTLQHPRDWHLEQLHLLGAQTVPCNFHTWTPDQPGACEAIIDLNRPVLTHISNIHSQRFDFQEDLLKASSLQLYTSSGNRRRIPSRDLQSLTGQYSGVQGSIEAAPDFLEACPTSGANTLAILETEFPATIVTPILVGITSEGWRSSWHYHHFPSMNTFMASYIAAVGRGCGTWDSGPPQEVSKLFILLDGRALEARNIPINTWTRSIPWDEFLRFLRNKLSRAALQGLTFYYGIQSSEANTILFPEHWLHYVITVNHDSSGSARKRYWTGINAFYVPHTGSACQRLSQHINEHRQDVHLRHQNSDWCNSAQTAIQSAQSKVLSLTSTTASTTSTAPPPTQVDADGKP
jgi:hypothetical protein